MSGQLPVRVEKNRLTRRTNEMKSVILFGLLFTDLLLNSTLEYDEYNSYPTMFGIHLFVQLCCFVVVFLMLCETYPFRVGLIDALLAEFRAVLWIHPMYFFLTLFLGLFRIITIKELSAGRRHFRRNNGMWDTSTQAGLRYTTLSHVHKVLGAVYYFINIRAAVRLGDSIYYAKDSWVTLFHQTGGSQRELRKLLQRRHNTMDDIVASR